jgi:hypothetical protein
MWRDELQAWGIARETPSLAQFFHHMRYEGTPPLWHLILRPLAAGHWPAESMQVVHVLLAGLLVFLLWQYAPFTRIQKVLLSVNYYIFYQYAVISRNYVLGLLFLTLACVFFPTRRTRPWRLGMALALASLTSVHALLVALGLACGVGLEKENTLRSRRIAVGVFLIGTFLAITFMKPAPDALFPSAAGWFTRLDISRALKVIYLYPKTFLAIPTPTLHFWETSWVEHLPYYKTTGFLLAEILFFWCAISVWRNPTARIAYGVGTLGLLTFFYVKYMGYSRHHGFLFFNFLFSLWLSRASIASSTQTTPFWTWAQKAVTPVFTALLIVQAGGAAIAVQKDLFFPFSNGRAAARYISSQRPPNTFLSAGPDYAGCPLSGYLQETLYYPQGQRWGSFTSWDRRRIEILTDQEFLARALEESRRQGKNVLVALDHPLNLSKSLPPGLRFLKSFENSILGDENYFLYFIPL